MGVDLGSIIKPTKISLGQITHRVVAIDAFNALYQFLAIIRGGAGEHLMDGQGRVTSHLSGLFYRNVNLLAMNVKPIYILDGQPPALKAMEIARRRAVKKEAVIKYHRAISEGRFEEARKFAQATSIIREYMVEDTKHMLDLLGIPWIDAPSEGEATAAHLTEIGLASDTASQDFDSLLFGAKRLIRNLTISGRRKLPNKPVYVEVEPEEIELDKILLDLGISREQLVDLGILLGTDFNPDGFKNIGPAKAFKYIKTYGELEAIPDITDQLKKTDYRAIREIFLRPRVAKPGDVKWSRTDYDGIIRFLCSEKDFSEDRVTKTLQKLRSVDLSRSQDLEKWFA
jgi:flap endonuclease-1